jgi:hypothetical protein
MLAGGTDALYRQALAAPHEPYTRIEVWRGNEMLADDLTILSGAVVATLTSRVARTFDFTVAEDLYPVADDALLSPFSSYIKAFRGIQFADGSFTAFQVYRGRITDAHLAENGVCTITSADRAQEVIDNPFATAQNSQVGNLVTAEIERVIDESLPDAVFGASDTFPHLVPVLTWEHDRGAALDEMATAIGAFWYPLANGEFVIRRYPWTVRRTPVVTYSDGDGGTVTGSSSQRSRNGIFNAVTVTGERADGTTPVFATAEDNNPDSPTRVGGPFGRRGALVRLNTPSTENSAAESAQALLKRATALTEAWELSMVPDAALELGDPISLNVRGRTGIIQVVAGLTIPMDVPSSMTVSCRAMVFSQLPEAV